MALLTLLPRCAGIDCSAKLSVLTKLRSIVNGETGNTLQYSTPPTAILRGRKDATSFALKADIAVSIPGADKAKVKALADDAHQICPYSKATRNNIPVTLSVV